MDYLQRDSFFTGVTEGSVGVERILEMLNVVNDSIVVEEKGVLLICQKQEEQRIKQFVNDVKLKGAEQV